MQNQTWPRRAPKIVPITIDFDGRGCAGAAEEGGKKKKMESAVGDEEGDGEESWSLSFGSWGLSSRSEVLRRFLVVVTAVAPPSETVAGQKHGKRSRRMALVMADGF